MGHSEITIIVLVAAVAFFIWNKFSVGTVAFLAAISLYLTGVLTLPEAFQGFSDPAIIFVGGLFVISEALNSSGITNWAGDKVYPLAKKKSRYLILITMGLVAPLAAIITSNGAVAALLPIVIVLTLKVKQTPSKILMPLAFAGHAGSLLALTGSPVNILANEAAAGTESGAFGFFEFAFAGLPILFGTVLIVLVFSFKLLPNNKENSANTKDFSNYSEHMVKQYLDSGTTQQLQFLAQEQKLVDETNLENLISAETGIAEIIIPPRSTLIGKEVFTGMVTDSGDMIILSINRGGENFAEKTKKIQAGDTLLLRGDWDKIAAQTDHPEVLFLEDPEEVRKQTAPLGKKAYITLVMIVLMIAALVSNIVPASVAILLAALALVMTNVVTVERAHKVISWSTLMLLGGMFSVSVAITKTGLAQQIATQLVNSVGVFGPYAILLALGLVILVLGQLISNTATALILIPIAVSVAGDMQVSAQPFLMGVVVMAAASFLTPIATPANLFVMKPGGYKFGDYWKLGLPMALFYLFIAVVWVPFVWKF